MYSKHNGYGITLIELIVVLGILSVLTCLCVPFFNAIGYKNEEVLLNTVSKELMCDLRSAQQKSMEEGCIYHVFFDKINNSYIVYCYKDMTNYIYKNRRLPDGISFYDAKSSYADNKVSFNSSGKPLPFPCTIALRDSKGRYRLITITVGTDYISLKE